MFHGCNSHNLCSCCTGGDSKALMFVQISPSENDVGETLSSLNFASRVRGIELGPAKKQVDTGELQKMKQMVSMNIPGKKNFLPEFINLFILASLSIFVFFS